MNTKRTTALAVILSLALIAALVLPGCGSLTRILENPDPPRETTSKELTNLVRTGDTYAGIEILHGTWEEPCYSPDNKGYFYEYRGWIYLHIEGEPAERGYQHGWLMADYIQMEIDHNKEILAHLQAIDWQYFKDNASRMWTNKVEPEYQAELEGIVAGAAERGATFDYLDLLVMNGLEELRDCWFPTVENQYYQELAAGLWNPVTSDQSVSASFEASSEDAEEAESEEEATSEAAATEEGASSDEEAASDDQTSFGFFGSQQSSSNDDESEEDDAASAPAVTGPRDAEEATSDSSGTNDEADADADEDSDEESFDQDADEEDEESMIALLPYVEIQGITNVLANVSSPEAIKKKSAQQGAVYLKQATVILATGSATEDGGIVLAQNTVAAYTNANFSNIMLNVEPAEGQSITMQAAPGYIHSVAEAYSTESLLVANTLIAGFDLYCEEGTPEFLRIRKAVQYATSLDEFVNSMLAGVNGGLASNWLVGSLETGQIMELELGLSYYNVQKLLDGCIVSFNGVEDTRILNYETSSGDSTDTRTSEGSRHARTLELIKTYQGSINADNAQTIISDHFDTYQNKISAGSRSICAHYELDDAAYSPSSNTEPYMPYGTVDAKVMTSELAAENTILARWGSACGRAFDSESYLNKNPQYASLTNYLYDRPSYFWSKLYPLDD